MKKSYTQVLFSLQKADNNVANLQRIKDKVIDKLERKYKLKLDKALQELKERTQEVQCYKDLILGEK